MKLELKKFGDILVSRPAGGDAAKAILIDIAKMPETERIVEIDFEGVIVLTPSWMHEFILVISRNVSSVTFKYLPSDNMSVVESLKYVSNYEFLTEEEEALVQNGIAIGSALYHVYRTYREGGSNHDEALRAVLKGQESLPEALRRTLGGIVGEIR